MATRKKRAPKHVTVVAVHEETGDLVADHRGTLAPREAGAMLRRKLRRSTKRNTAV